jgi:DMSO/TMAO reductase YedYZ molybdopterin-dependent catalytic subunit
MSIIVSSVVFAGCNSTGPESSSNSISTLSSVEITEYQGERLSSIDDFRENSIKGIQYIDIETYVLKVDGLVEKPAEYSYDQVLENTLYKKVITLNCVEGWSVKLLWEGVLLKDLFDKVIVKGEADTVIFYSVDGYSTSLPLKTILEKDMILAYKINEVVLPAQRGFPFQLVAEDKLGYKWAKWIDHIELSSDSEYKGYWEQRGYTNEADLK